MAKSARQHQQQQQHQTQQQQQQQRETGMDLEIIRSTEIPDTIQFHPDLVHRSIYAEKLLEVAESPEEKALKISDRVQQIEQVKTQARKLNLELEWGREKGHVIVKVKRRATMMTMMKQETNGIRTSRAAGEPRETSDTDNGSGRSDSRSGRSNSESGYGRH